MTTTKLKHQEISAELLAQAEEEFRKGDLLQAVEKGWESVAQYLDAVAEQQGWEHETRRDLHQNATRMFKLTGNFTANCRKMALINVLHVNYYDDPIPAEDVRIALNGVRATLALFEDAERVLNGGQE